MTDPSEEPSREVEVQVDPLPEFLRKTGIDRAEFEEAVSLAFDEVEESIDAHGGLGDDVPSIHEPKVVIQGREYALGEIAIIKMTGDLE